MTNNPTIDGVSRELLQNLLHCGDTASTITPYVTARIRELLDAPAVERQDEVQMASMPVHRCYDVRSKMIIAFNEAKKAGGDLDEALEAAYQSALRFSPAPQDFADQKSTIARLEARVAELESGRGEAIGRVSYIGSGFVRVRTAQCLAMEQLLFTAPPAPVAVVLPPFAEKVISKLRRCEECFSDFESGGVDIGRHWLDLLTQLGLLNRVQRSPAMWEITQQGEACLDATASLNKSP